MDWNTTRKGMLKIAKYFLVLGTPGFPPTVPLGSVDLSPGLRFSVAQHRTQVWCSQHGLQGSLRLTLLSRTGLYLPSQPYPLLLQSGQDLFSRSGLSRSLWGCPWMDLTTLPQTVLGLLWSYHHEK